MSMHVDEPRAHDAPGNVDPPAGVSRSQVTQRDNAASSQPNIRPIGMADGSVDDLSARENELHH